MPTPEALNGSESSGTLCGWIGCSRERTTYVSMEAEIPEVLYRGMKEFIGDHPHWDQYRLMSSALAHFLFQNGCSDRAVTERYLDDLFSRSQA